jgi:hypothetical protein
VAIDPEGPAEERERFEKIFDGTVVRLCFLTHLIHRLDEWAIADVLNFP